MARICVAGFYGFHNTGDEGVLQAIMDSLGPNHEYIIATSLPFPFIDQYRYFVPTAVDIRTFEDTRLDFDLLLIGGGGLTFGYGWQLALHALCNKKPVMYYGVGLRQDIYYHPTLHNYYAAMIEHFVCTVRDIPSHLLLQKFSNVLSFLTMCPAINLQEKKIQACASDAIVVCPRFEDFSVGDNTEQKAWILRMIHERIKQEGEREVIFIPFSPVDLENAKRDLLLCEQLIQEVPQSRIFLNLTPKEIKYVISKANYVISGGRYHALLWAASHNVPCSCYNPLTLHTAYPKIEALLQMLRSFDVETLKSREHKNAQTANSILERGPEP